MVEVVVTGAALRTGFGRGAAALLADGFAGTTAFGPVTRFDTAGRRTDQAAALPGAPSLVDELVGAIRDAGPPRGTPLLLAAHATAGTAELAGEVAARVGAAGVARTYTGACVAAGSAVADAATMIATGRAERVVVAAGYLVDAEMFGVFDAGRALARDGRVRPFSAGRQGMVLGDGVAAVVLAAAGAPRPALARLLGWSRQGDAYHVVRPRPDGSGLARTITAALARAGLAPERIGYVNANGTGTDHNDAAEAAALEAVFGPGGVPVSSTKSVHGHALEASGLVELVVTVLALRHGRLPVNSGYLGPDSALDVITAPRTTSAQYALSVNTAFGGANTALLVGAP
ncbi:beta-ketoacyl synthase N-terminal-like domain-containing protein [Actinokineospora sp. NPDC004072]